MKRRLYAAYTFRGKDPSIAELKEVIEEHCGRSVNGKDISMVNKNGGPSAAAMRAWFFGKTLRPQSATLEAAGRACGWRRKWVKL